MNFLKNTLVVMMVTLFSLVNYQQHLTIQELKVQTLKLAEGQTESFKRHNKALNSLEKAATSYEKMSKTVESLSSHLKILLNGYSLLNESQLVSDNAISGLLDDIYGEEGILSRQADILEFLKLLQEVNALQLPPK